MKEATSIEFIENLVQYNYDDCYYDFHNDYICERISYSDGTLLIVFKNIIDGLFLSMRFTEVKINRAEFFNVNKVDGLTIDSLYRGRIELDGELIEVSKDGKGYFYVEFYEGQKMEFWARSIGIE